MHYRETHNTIIPVMDLINAHVAYTLEKKHLPQQPNPCEIHITTNEIWVTFLGITIWSSENDERKWSSGSREPMEPFLLKQCNKILAAWCTIKKIPPRKCKGK